MSLHFFLAVLHEIRVFMQIEGYIRKIFPLHDPIEEFEAEAHLYSLSLLVLRLGLTSGSLLSTCCSKLFSGVPT